MADLHVQQKKGNLLWLWILLALLVVAGIWYYFKHATDIEKEPLHAKTSSYYTNNIQNNKV